MAVNSECFSKIEAFKSLTEDQRFCVLPLCEELVFQEGERLFAEGDPAKHVWFVVDGQVDLRFEWPLTRNGCRQHRLEFKNIDDAFRVFQNQDEVGLPHAMGMSARYGLFKGAIT
ncbi:MAG: cyclic nucleotide-binding domain-containing protein [Geobacteraceae bacterium]|nr:MAG: cyclic nucleotide-binding domain-containing protein [Geobacteraceae bacterium]